MTHRNLHHLSLLVLALLMAACAGVSTTRIKTEPEGAKLFVNGKYVGLTPQELPQAWAGAGGVTLRLELVKDGYQTRHETITHAELVRRFYAGDTQGASRYGYGHTFDFTYPLEPAGSAAPARAPTIRRSPPASPTPPPKSSQSWR